MTRNLRHLRLITMVFFLAAPSAAGTAEPTDLIYKICFPASDTDHWKSEECKDEDCGLYEAIYEEQSPTVLKGQRYTLLGATDYGIIWGAENKKAIGEDRVRFLLYVKPAATRKVNYSEMKYRILPDRIIQTAFFSAFGSYQGSAVSVSYNVEKKVERHEEVCDNGPGVLEVIDLHCKARKMKIYDNHTIFYRTVESQSQPGQCVELLWEKPHKPLRWHPASPMTMDILVDFYCRANE